MSAFLLTHQLVMSSARLLDLLIQRYNVPYPKKCDIEVKNKYEAKVVRPVRLRVFTALKQWVDKFSVDFASEEMARTVIEFAETTMKVNLRACLVLFSILTQFIEYWNAKTWRTSR